MIEINPAGIIVPDFPMSPSANALNKNARRGGLGGRVNSEKYEDFKSDCELWMYVNLKQIPDGRECIRQLLDEFGTIRVDIDFFFSYGRIFTKKEEFKSFDTFNFIKALHDCFADIFHFNDKYIKTGMIRTIATHKKERCHINVIGSKFFIEEI